MWGDTSLWFRICICGWWGCWAPFHTCVAYSYIFFEECLFKFVAHFKNRIVCPFWCNWVLVAYYIFWILVPFLSNIRFANIFLPCCRMSFDYSFFLHCTVLEHQWRSLFQHVRMFLKAVLLVYRSVCLFWCHYAHSFDCCDFAYMFWIQEAAKPPSLFLLSRLPWFFGVLCGSLTYFKKNIPFL